MMTEPKIPKDGAHSEEDSQDEDNTQAGVVNLQKRKGDVEATRYGDWELNGRCIDF